MERRLNIWMKYSIACVMALFVLVQGVHGQGVVDDNLERAALLALYSTNGAEWNLSATNKWTVDKINGYPDSTLYGVGVENGDIVTLSLDYINLSGALPSELNYLTSLEYMSLSNNNITGQMPDLENLVNLKQLSFREHSFSGTLNPSITGLTNLTTLDLSTSKLNSFIVNLPDSIFKLNKLTSLNLSGCNLSNLNSIPTSFSGLSSLKTLNLDNTKLNANSFEDSALIGLAISSLNLSNNGNLVTVNDTLLNILHNLPSLTTLYLRNVDFKHLNPDFANLSSLSSLYLEFNNFSDTTILSNINKVLKDLTGLRYLYLSNCQIVNLPPNINQLSNIDYLSLSNNGNLNDSTLALLTSMSGLSQLTITNCNLSNLPIEFSGFHGLRILNLSRNGFYPVTEVIKEIPNLISLDLSQNGILYLPSWFGTGNMDSLETLVLNNNGLNLPLDSNFSLMKNLKSLNMSNNNLEGTIPTVLSPLTKLGTLNLDNNKLESPIPDLSSLTLLRTLTLNNNQFTGSFPAYFSNQVNPKVSVKLQNNRFDSLPVFNYNGSLTLSVENNILTFKQIALQPSNMFGFTYAPQKDSVDTYRINQGFVGGTASFSATADRDVEGCVYQWYRVTNNSKTALPESGPDITTSITNQGQMDAKYFYTIRHPNYPHLTLNSRLQTLSVYYCPERETDFSTYIYNCVVRFTPTPFYVTECDVIEYEWDFGDGTSSKEKSPLHAFGEEGTFNVSLRVRFACSNCPEQFTIKNKAVAFNVSESDNFRDSTIQVITHQLPLILASSASTFSDAWPLPTIDAVLEAKNEFENGTQGVWRNEESHVYNVNRQQSSAPNLKLDGTFQQDQFSWAQSEWGAIPQWIRANTITHYNAQGYEVENQDVLGIYTSAIYDYEGHLPTANGLNMRQDEMAFSSFEDLQANTSGNWIVSNNATTGFERYQVIGMGNAAFVKAPLHVFSGVAKVSVRARFLSIVPWFGTSTFYNTNDTIICKEVRDDLPEESTLVLKVAPSGLWTGLIQVDRPVQNNSKVFIDDTYAHSGKHSIKVDEFGDKTGDGTEAAVYRQEILKLDSGKTYLLSAWVSEKQPHLPSPFLSNGIGIEVVLRDKNNTVRGSYFVQPQGRIIEGWQQVKGLFTVPGNNIVMEISFKKGQAPVVWYDDLRLHPERGNMKTYVYNTQDYRLQAILDEENYATYYYYDKEGNLYLVKKETEEGIKTLSESITHQIEPFPEQ